MGVMAWVIFISLAEPAIREWRVDFYQNGLTVNKGYLLLTAQAEMFDLQKRMLYMVELGERCS